MQTTTVPGVPVTPEVISGGFPVPTVTNTPVTYSGQLPAAPLDGTTVVAGTPGRGTTGAFATPPTASTFGSFTVQPLAPGSFDAFVGTGQSSAGIIATEPPLNSNPATPPPGLLSTPAPLNAGTPAPLLGTPAPLNAAPALPLPATPSPVLGPAMTAPAPAAPAASGP
ncbi:hypothetical protein QEG98_13965 [Myxococcus sp. MxC21-1]|uniref:hypothetical protein n=1 Tax=Myxococcus sp. MxC21-1 TaxID=3041439 RepID=UPI002930AA22|nr:hypothetical protein [Myxococcus sp. MxC21-1]WNZ64675.1 hypothetical protein QEG98_13965 [Myxococcus sp. MxC21-1]